jgi:hypothetical protein
VEAEWSKTNGEKQSSAHSAYKFNIHPRFQGFDVPKYGTGLRMEALFATREIARE